MSLYMYVFCHKKMVRVNPRYIPRRFHGRISSFGPARRQNVVRHAAATAIQTRWRMHLARRRVGQRWHAVNRVKRAIMRSSNRFPPGIGSRIASYV